MNKEELNGIITKMMEGTKTENKTTLSSYSKMLESLIKFYQWILVSYVVLVIASIIIGISVR